MRQFSTMPVAPLVASNHTKKRDDLFVVQPEDVPRGWFGQAARLICASRLSIVHEADYNCACLSSQYAVKLRRERARLADETEVGGQISSGGTICQETTPSQWENPVHQRRRPAPWNEDNQSKHTKSGDTRVTVVRGYTRFADIPPRSREANMQ